MQHNANTAQPSKLLDNPLGRIPDSGFLRQSQLIPAIVPFSSATLWRKVATGTFPKPVKLSKRVTAWAVEDLRLWIADPLNYRAN
ncbi:hypothetical protein D8I24_5668 [Cupriavidus necator H850]|uniref:helix-turn-helix transcriptional regulator n=1 Tax=Cupriavidus necator TaxID=106590 RepID=UPI00129D60A7|nr:AlpA family phage regulatory protein [Cupriavidus necator]KAI3598722.1 hypothetical protein D8I24_5668 [Cupriavidus necator H850]